MTVVSRKDCKHPGKAKADAIISHWQPGLHNLCHIFKVILDRFLVKVPRTNSVLWFMAYGDGINSRGLPLCTCMIIDVLARRSWLTGRKVQLSFVLG